MDNNKAKILKNLSLISYIGFMMVIPIFGGVYLGNLVDKKLGTGHAFLIIFLLIGVSSGFLNLYKIMMKDIHKK